MLGLIDIQRMAKFVHEEMDLYEHLIIYYVHKLTLDQEKMLTTKWLFNNK